MNGFERVNDGTGEAYTKTTDVLDIVSGTELKIDGTAISVSAAVINGSSAYGGSATGLTALAGGTATGATALKAGFNNVTTSVTAGDSVKLPTAVVGTVVRVKNSGATAIDIFPFASDSIDALAVNLAVRLEPGGTAQFHAISVTVWESDVDFSLTLNAPTTVKGDFRILAADNDGNTTFTLTNAAMGQASEISIPDPGAATANIMLTSAANDGNLIDATSEEINAACDTSKKNEVVTTTNVITAAENGKTFFLNAAVGFISTLPAAALGLEYTFIVKTQPTSGTLTIYTNTGANILYGSIDVDSTLVLGSANDTISFVNSTSLPGDRVTVKSDGAVWYIDGTSGASGGITITTAA